MELHRKNEQTLSKTPPFVYAPVPFAPAQHSVCVLTQDSPPLHYRRLTLSASLLSSIAQLPSTPIHDCLFSKSCDKFKSHGAYTHLLSYLNHSLSHHIRFNCLLPIYPSAPPWSISLPKIILKLTELPKRSTNNTIILAHFHEILADFPTHLSVTPTDLDSKTELVQYI